MQNQQNIPLTQTSASSPLQFSELDALVEHILQTVGKQLVLGIPLGIGKPNPLVNALYRRVKADPELSLTILSALSLEKPHGNSELEQRFIGPLVERVFGDYPDLEYVGARRRQELPANVRVIEFFLKTGDYLENDAAQQDFICTNYTNAARDMLAQGVNLLAQAVAVDDSAEQTRLSLSSNPDTTLDMLDLLQQSGRRNEVLTIACYNRKLPFMEHEAVVQPGMFDCILQDPGSTHDLFAPPNMKVSLQDYAIGLYASSLVKDGGTLQIGIGSLGDAIAHSLILRQKDNAAYARILQSMGSVDKRLMQETGVFEQGLYGCSEMFVNGFMHLIQQGIVRREVVDDELLQDLLNQGKLQNELQADTLKVLQQAGAFGTALDADKLAWLQSFGIIDPAARYQNGYILLNGVAICADPLDLSKLSEQALGSRLQNGIYMHGGFFLGPREFYSQLRELSPEQRSKIGMRRISRINSLYGHERLARLQRKDARFINTTMTISLLGAAASDSLDSGRVVSGVGGQYNFVAMADALPDARSILMLRSTHARNDKIWSNIVWNYGQTTIPRHLRDIVITEYGIADLRGQTDAECVKRILAICDAHFQEELVWSAKKNGKLPIDYVLPDSYRNNTVAALETSLRGWRQQGLLPDFPFGTDFTEDEIVIVKALKKLKASIGHPLDLLKVFLHSFADEPQHAERYLERMNMEELDSLKMRLLRRLFVGNLS